ncbi:bifunctional [glutamate--ammonia ligase]-adenylyl-L-tyrosine phosphorylase/[glutamate--ammonia-ligase] adenylyltransferase [Candidatus Igneacidithiobacillus taiwanensis]|uniref:bifunctional [glutamate--ammonia ligase]-adenylyl-L-tyrosine phosphorylase/[glutamate--ammonia-ligase] adenylyltransferase n=2 Tax=Candidatus Igneacidithiobacillus taiwanensis TaxID=1945924 RepID=UPI0028A1BEF3|nr:bifunctional [glutamate--ammonia ligase]-adenylyl-L-tyrosine phosphorylase/[glutamate--ammonia-ligase] adenylyltransferase [Candidatus Igneacidithiobacillus taiwanensis]
MMNMSLSPPNPPCLQELPERWPAEWERVAEAIQSLRESAGEAADTLPKSSEQEARLRRLLFASLYARQQLTQHPEYLGLLLAGLAASPPGKETSEEEFLADLRRYRQQRMLQILWHDLSGPEALDGTLSALSRLAEETLQWALDYGARRMAQRHGVARDELGQPVPFAVIGMGKLGGVELNLSSDIDLLFLYGATGESDGPLPLDNATYFQRLGQWLIRALAENRPEGFIFRVDMRLRPFGDAGPLCVTGDALEQYYHRHGRSWERYALLKARAVAGDLAFGSAVLARLQPFLYRRYLDFTALAGLRRVKALMDAEQGRASQDIKKGFGGIREIEFIVQSLQLIHGGRLPQLRQRNTLQALEQIAAAGLLQEDAITTLRQNYRFWRRVEHALQMIDDRQTQTLPSDPLGWMRLSCALGGETPAILQERIASGRAAVHALYLAILPAQPEGDEEDIANLVWLAARHALDDAAPEAWQQLLAADPESTAWQELRRFARSRRVLQLSQRGQARLDALLPAVLRRLTQSGAPAILLHRQLGLLDALLGQPQYLALLAENPHWLGRLEELLASPWLAQELTRFPTLLEDVLCQRSSAARDWPQLFSTSEDQGRDLEERMDLLRRFKNTETLLLASDFWAERKEIDSLLTDLSELASFCLQRALPWAVEAMLQQHGPLPGYPELPFAIIAYGKLGGMEMGLASDLDLVFLYDLPPDQESSGRIPLTAGAWFARLGQKLIHILSVLTRAGNLYEIDLRLRPSGQSGPLVSSLSAFSKYQRESAWTWEHQALTRARFIAGDPKLGQRFVALREEILSQRRDPITLAAEIGAMRQRIAREKPIPCNAFHLKLSPGGLVDIEFLVQFAILSLSADNSALLHYPGTRSALQAIATLGLWEEGAVSSLLTAWRALREAENRCWLRLEPPLLERGHAQFAALQDLAGQVRQWTLRLGLGPTEE